MKKALLIATLSVLCAAGANAAESGYFGGISVGNAHSDFKVAPNQNDTSVDAYIGYRYSPRLSTEVGYGYFGKATTNAGADVRESALSVSGIVHTPLWVGFEAFGKFGVAYTRLNDDLGHKWQPVIGAGLDYSLTKAISLRGQVLYTHNFANTDSHVVNTSIGAAYRF